MLKAKIENISQSSEQMEIQMQTETKNTNRISCNEEIDNDELKMTIDCSKSKDLEKINNSQELSTPKTLIITSINKIDESNLNNLNSFFEKLANAKLEVLVIESDSESSYELYTLIESLSIMLPYVSGSITFKGFNLDSIAFNQLIESIYNVENFSLINWCLDIKSEISFEVPTEFKLKNLELSNISLKDDINESSIQSKAKILTQSLFKVAFFKNLDKAQISKSTRFEQHFSNMIFKTLSAESKVKSSWN